MVISKQTLLYLSFFLLIFFAPKEISTSPYYFPNHLAGMIDHFDNKAYFGQLLAYVWGEKAFMSFKHTIWHNDLYLQHLFTPSGLHLASLLFVLKILPKKNKFFHFIEFLLLFATFLPPALYALKRMALFRIGGKMNSLFLGKKFSHKEIFFCSFGLDFLMGSYQLSPLSFALSYLFVGTLLILNTKNIFRFIYFLFCAQLLVAIIFYKPFYPLAFFIGLILSSIFTLLFPALLLGLISYPLLPNFSEYLLRFYTLIIEKCHQPFIFYVEIHHHLKWLSFILLFSLKINYQKKITLLIVLIFIMPDLAVAPEKYSGFYLKKKKYQYVRSSLRDL